MKALGIGILIALALLLFFAIANWSLVSAPASLNLLAFSVDGPLGLILLGATFLLVALIAIYALSVRTSALLETRRYVKELEAQRALADDAERSRFSALGTQIGQEFASVREAIAQSRTESFERIQASERSLARALEETANSIYAHLGQLDDKVDRLAQRER
jgi:uncharacterized integral membrane protein